MQLTTLLISTLVGLSVGSMVIGFRLLRKPTDIERRMRLLVGDQPVTLRELELQQSFTTRVLKPLLRRALQAAGRMAPGANVERLQRDLILAGSPYNMSLLDFMGLRLISGLVVAIAIVGAAYALMREAAFPLPIVAGAGGFIVGLYLPNYWLKRRIKQRQKEIVKALPDALDMLMIAVEAGLGFDQALAKVAEKWDNALTREFGRVVGEMRLGVRRADALRNMVYRTGVDDLASFVAVLIQADRLGVSIASVLHAQSEQLRTRRRQRAEEAARKAPLKMLFPLVLFIFPSLFVVILGPAVPRFLAAFGG